MCFHECVVVIGSVVFLVCGFEQRPEYEIRIRHWSSDVCSSDRVPAPAETQAPGGAAVEYEPDEEAILADLLPRNVTIQVFKGLLENAASEQGASMTAMDNATRNAGELINKLTIVYNRQRSSDKRRGGTEWVRTRESEGGAV